MGWKDSDRLGKYQRGMIINLRAYCRSNNLGVGETTDLYGNFGCIWRLYVSYYNINKITCWFNYPFWCFDNVVVHPGKAK